MKKDSYLSLSVPKTKRRISTLRLNTCANMTSVIFKGQYCAYCRDHVIYTAIKPPNGLQIRGIGVKRPAIGIAKIQIPFVDLTLIIDVYFLINEKSIPSLLSMRDRIHSWLGISIQQALIYNKEFSHKLTLENFFLIHNWDPEIHPRIYYTEAQLRTMRCAMYHPSIIAT